MRQIFSRNPRSFSQSNWGSLTGPVLEKIFTLSPNAIPQCRVVNKHWHCNSFDAVKRLQPNELSKVVEDFKKLEEIDLSKVQIQPCDQSLRHLENLSKLGRINFFGCWKVTVVGLQYLQRLVHLTALSFSSCPQLIDQDVVSLTALTSIQDLDLSECSAITDQSLVHLSNLSEMQKLTLRNCESIAFSPPAMASFGALSKITSLDLSNNTNINDQAADCLNRLSLIQILNIKNTKMSSVGLSRLSGLFKLTTLNCSECYSVGHGNLDLRQLSALQDLGFNSCNITDEDLALISQMEKVKVLNISVAEYHIVEFNI